MNACSRRRGAVPLILSLGSRWKSVVNVMPRPLYPGQRILIPNEHELGGSETAGEWIKFVPLAWFETPTLQLVAYLLYHLH